MAFDPNKIAMAFPVAESHRKVLRRIGNHPLPIMVPGSAVRPCAECGLRLAVGPRICAALDADPKYTLLCLLCALEITGGHATAMSLGNPDQALTASGSTGK